MAARKQIPYSEKDLFAPGEQLSYSGDSLKEIAFPLGGIGTGTVSLGGRGQLRDWEIFNRPGKGKGLAYTFPAIYTRTASGKSMARVLESKMLPSFSYGNGMPPTEACGLPRLADAVFKGEYPFAQIEFKEPKLPVKVELTAFNPMIPLNEKDSAIPAAILRYRVTNKSKEKVDVTICWSLQNACGNNGEIGGVRQNPLYGLQKNDFVDEKSFRGIKMTQSKYAKDDIHYGSMAIVTTHKKVTCMPTWQRSGWWDDFQKFWDDFSSDGELTDIGIEDVSADKSSDIGSLGLKFSLAPGETAEAPFVIAWHFPNRENYWNVQESVKGAKLRNRYADLWQDAWDVAGYVVANMGRLESESAKFRDALYTSTLPRVVTDAAGANMSILRTNTGLYLEDDRFYGFEGCSDNRGCCPMNCTHVYNYEQSLAYLYPRLERSVRLTDFTNQIRDEDGKMAFRTLLPLGNTEWGFHGAADGQMGCILKLWREYRMSGDWEFVKSIYPGVKKAMEYAWVEWDQDQDGVMEGIQHNTYDIEFKGPNTMMGSLYLGALLAMKKMAKRMGDKDMVAKCKDLFEKGKAKYPELLWNGEFYIQPYDPSEGLRYQFGKGCLSDQLLGQWFCEVAGLGYVLPEDQVRSTLESIFKYNWRSDLSDHASCQRTYAINDEAGLLLCSWPNGGRPEYPFVYADEVWTGIEYQVAAHLMYENMLEEGLAIVKGVRDRHDGIARNPWDEFECGHHYARAMASWSLILALSGYDYNAPDKHIAFAPKVNASNFSSIYTTGTGWGSYKQKLAVGKLKAEVGVAWGSLELVKVGLEMPSDMMAKKVQVKAGSEVVEASFAQDGDRVVVTLAKAVKIEAGDTLSIVVA
jgi:non-lysosomal glucosylceramidase